MKSQTKSEQIMNAEFAKLLEATKNSTDYSKKTLAKITRAQAAWLLFRERECDVDYELPTSASTYKAIGAVTCRTAMAEERTEKVRPASKVCATNGAVVLLREDARVVVPRNAMSASPKTPNPSIEGQPPGYALQLPLMSTR